MVDLKKTNIQTVTVTIHVRNNRPSNSNYQQGNNNIHIVNGTSTMVWCRHCGDGDGTDVTYPAKTHTSNCCYFFSFLLPGPTPSLPLTLLLSHTQSDLITQSERISRLDIFVCVCVCVTGRTSLTIQWLIIRAYHSTKSTVMILRDDGIN